MKQDKTYVFRYTERASMDIEITAPSEKEARKKMREMYDDVYDITTIDTRDFGSPDMQHWQVGAR